MQLLSGENPVLEWFKGTALRPVLAALDEEARAEFLAEFGPKLLSAYPPASYGTLFRFRRVFVVAHTGSQNFLDPSRSCRVDSGESLGFLSSSDRPFQARLTRCAAISSSFGLRTSSHHWPANATIPTSIWE